MTLDLLFPNFAEIVRTPADVDALNQAILDLAVRGRLVAQESGDEPVEVLLGDIAEARRTLAGGSKLDPINTQAFSRIDNVPYPLPHSWKWVRFGDIVFSRDAERIPLSREVREGRQGEYDYYGASGVIDHINDYIFDKPLLLIGEDGANLLIRSKPIAFIATGKYWVNNHAHVIDAMDFRMLRYLELYVNAVDLAPYVTGTAQPKMNQTKMNSILVALPPLAEQRRIVAKVDELFAHTRALAARLEQAQAQRRIVTAAALHRVDTAADAPAISAAWATVREAFGDLFDEPQSVAALRQTILNLAVRGRLVAQDAEDEPASMLIKRLHSRMLNTEPQQKSKAKPQSSDMQWRDQPYDAPSGWEWTTLGFVYDVRDGTHETPRYHDSGVPFVTSKNLSGGKIDFSTARYISREDHERFSMRSLVEIDDILFAMIGSIGNPAIVEQDGFSCKNVALFKYYDPHLSVPKFLYFFLVSASARMRANSLGGVQSFVSLKFLREYPICLPPLAEQRRIVAKVDELMRLCDALEAKLAGGEAARSQLAGAVLAGVVA